MSCSVQGRPADGDVWVSTLLQCIRESPTLPLVDSILNCILDISKVCELHSSLQEMLEMLATAEPIQHKALADRSSNPGSVALGWAKNYKANMAKGSSVVDTLSLRVPILNTLTEMVSATQG